MSHHYKDNTILYSCKSSFNYNAFFYLLGDIQVHVIAGSPVHLKCSYSSPALRKEEWEFNYQSIVFTTSSLSKYRRNGELLVIDNIDKQDEGVYKCRNGYKRYHLLVSSAASFRGIPTLFCSCFAVNVLGIFIVC